MKDKQCLECYSEVQEDEELCESCLEKLYDHDSGNDT